MTNLTEGDRGTAQAADGIRAAEALIFEGTDTKP